MYLLDGLCNEDDIYCVYTVVRNEHEEDRHIPDRRILLVVYFVRLGYSMLLYNLFIYKNPLL